VAIRGVTWLLQRFPQLADRSNFICYFVHVVEEAWKKDVRSFRPDCMFRDRLKNVKVSLRAWSKERFGGTKEKIETLKNEAMRWELEAEKK
ncbi:hypothetical protein Tco_1374517, partial [Tanacetum coccineum]